MSLQIRKLSAKSFKHVDSIDGAFILSKFYAKTENNTFLIVEIYGSKRREYNVTDIEVYDIGGTAETFTNIDDLMLRLEELGYTGFYQDGQINPINYDLSEFENSSADPFAKESGLNLKQNILGFTPENVANKSTSTSLGTSDTLYPTQNAVKSYVDNNLQNDLHRSWQYVASSLEGSGLLFAGINAINRYIEIGTRSFVNPTGTSRLLSLYFQNYLSATTAGANAGLKMINNADGIIRQGFDAYFVFGNNDTNSSCQTVVGSYNSLAATIPNLNIADFTVDFFGVGNDVGEANLSFYCKRVAASGQTASYVKVSTSSSFPAHTTTDAYLLRMEAPQTETDASRYIKMTLTNLITGATISHTFPYTESPVLDRSVVTTCIRSNRNTGVATNLKFGKIHYTRKIF